MVIDTSALVAILFGESDAAALAAEIERDPTRLISAASILEAAMVVESELGEAGGRELDLLVLRAGIEIVTLPRSTCALPATPSAPSESTCALPATPSAPSERETTLQGSISAIASPTP